MEYLTQAQYCRQFGLSKVTVRKGCADGTIPFVTITGGRKRIPIPGSGETLADLPGDFGTSELKNEDTELAAARRDAELQGHIFKSEETKNKILDLKISMAEKTGRLEKPEALGAREQALNSRELRLDQKAKKVTAQTQELRVSVARVNRFDEQIAQARADFIEVQEWCMESIQLIQEKTGDKIELPPFPSALFRQVVTVVDNIGKRKTDEPFPEDAGGMYEDEEGE